jgi:hypothetical protein
LRLTFRAAALALLAGCGAQPAVTSPAAAIVDSLYRIRLPFQGHGAPTATELTSMSPWLSAELRLLLWRADSSRSAEAAAAPDEKPSFADGDLFTSLFEGPTGFEVGEAKEAVGAGEATIYRVPVHFTYRDSSTAQRWVDTVLVASENGRMVVSDVRYGGNWVFANKGSLLTSLTFSFVPQAR